MGSERLLGSFEGEVGCVCTPHNFCPCELANGMTRDKQHRDGRTVLLLKAGRGDTKAFAQLHATLRPAVYDFLASLDSSMDHHQREDMVQEVFLRTWQAASSFKGNASAKTFVFAIAKNLLRKEWSCRQWHATVHVGGSDHLSGIYVSGAPAGLHQPDRDALSQSLRQAMAKLTEAQRQAFELDQIRGLPRTEAVKRTNCTPNQFADRLYQAQRRLKQLLKDQLLRNLR